MSSRYINKESDKRKKSKKSKSISTSRTKKDVPIASDGTSR